MTDIRQNTEDALAEAIEQSLGPDWTARDAARMIMDQLSDIGLQYADNVAISQPNEPGSFKGDIWFGHPEKRTLGTHQWNGERWQVLPSELDSSLQLLAQARADNARLMGLVKYARHQGGCRRGIWPDLTPTLPCDCGLSEALANIKETPDA